MVYYLQWTTEGPELEIGSTLSQTVQPAALYPKTLSKSEINGSSVDTEAQAII